MILDFRILMTSRENQENFNCTSVVLVRQIENAEKPEENNFISFTTAKRS